MRTKKVRYITFNLVTEPDLIAKLNTVARQEKRKVHALARIILTDYLDKYITENDKDVKNTRPSVAV